MGKITITDITAGSTMTPADVTSTVDSWKSSTVNGSNVRDEGLDERMFAPETSGIVSEFHEWTINSTKSNVSTSYEKWETLTVSSVPAAIGPITYNPTESTVVVRFNAELIMPDTLASTANNKAVPKDPKMEIGYRLAYIISPNKPHWYSWNEDLPNSYLATPFHHTFRKVALSPYPRQCIGSSRYKNNICTTLVLNDLSEGRAGSSFPKPAPGDLLWIGAQLKIYEKEGSTDFYKNNSCRFSIKNGNLNCAHYKR